MPKSIPVGNVLKGVTLVIIATMTFALADVITKRLTMLYSVALIVALRYAVNLALLLVVYWPKHGRALFATKRTGLVVLRGCALAFASLTMGLALRYMPVAETVAIIYIAPIGVMVLAVPLLGEKVALSGWIGAFVGFMGVLLIVRPGAGLDPIGVAFALTNALGATAYTLLSRVLSRTESTMALLVYTAAVGLTVFTVLLPWADLSVLPSGIDIVLVLALGLLATLGHFLFTAAYREAPASLLAPVNYLHLVWAGFLGLMFFGHMPDRLTVLGMAMVAAAGIAVALRAHYNRRQAETARSPLALPSLPPSLPQERGPP